MNDATREAQRAEKDGRVQSLTGAAQGSGGGSPGPTVREVMAFRVKAAGLTPQEVNR